MKFEREAEVQLHAIRQLLERAAIYRVISAWTALAGGLLSVGTAFVMLLWQSREAGRNVDAVHYFLIWTLVLFVTLTANTLLILYEARRRGESPVSAGMKLTLRAVVPGLFAGGAISAVLTLTTEVPLLPTLMWVVFYGLALLSTMTFAPRPIVLLGWAFLLTGIGAFIYFMNQTLVPEFDLPTPTRFYPAAIMGAAFGGYHLIYAVCVWTRRAPLISQSAPP